MQSEKREQPQQKTANSPNQLCGLTAKHQSQVTPKNVPVSFCHRCGYPHGEQFCPRCGQRQCIACGDG
jgi:hypothetical protein